MALSLCKIYNSKTISLVSSTAMNVLILALKFVILLSLWARKFEINFFFVVSVIDLAPENFFQSKRKFRLGAKRLVFSFSHQFSNDG